MSTIEQSTLSIIETVARAESAGKDIYVTDKGKVKVQEGIAGWWAGRKIKNGSATQASHNQRAIDQFKAALSRESHAERSGAQSRQAHTLTRLAPFVTKPGENTQHLSPRALLNIRDTFVGPRADASQAGNAIVEQVKTGTYPFTGEAIASGTGALKIENDIRTLSLAVEQLNQEIDGLHTSAESLGAANHDDRVGQATFQRSQLQGALNLLKFVAEQEASGKHVEGADKLYKDLSTHANVLNTRSKDDVVQKFLSNEDGRLSALEAKTGIKLSDLDANKQAHFEKLLRAYVDPEYEIARDRFVLDAERKKLGGKEPDPTHWRGEDYNNDHAKVILKFLNQSYVNDEFFEDVDRDAAKAGAALKTLLDIGTRPLESLRQSDYDAFTKALATYAKVVGDTSSLQSYFRFGSDEEVPEAPEAVKERLQSTLSDQVRDAEGREALLGVLANDTLLNVLQANYEQFADVDQDPYEIASFDGGPDGVQVVNGATKKLLQDLLTNLTRVASQGIGADVPVGQEDLEDFIVSHHRPDSTAQPHIDKVLRPYAEAIFNVFINDLLADQQGAPLAGQTDVP